MKHIYLNLKRFDIPTEAGGVNRIASPAEWGPYIVSHTQDQLAAYNPKDVEFAMFFPEAHLIGAVSARKADSALKIGPQSVLGQDTAVGGNFGAFTSNRTGNAMKAIGCDAVLIGHCEERRDKLSIIAEGKGTDAAAVNRILNKEIKASIAAGLDVLAVEPMSPDCPLRELKDYPNLLITPHVAWASIEARTKLMQIILGQVKEFFHVE